MPDHVVTLSEDAYERLEAARREGETHSETIMRLTGGMCIMDSFGALSEETAEALENHIATRRRKRNRHPE